MQVEYFAEDLERLGQLHLVVKGTIKPTRNKANLLIQQMSFTWEYFLKALPFGRLQ